MSPIERRTGRQLSRRGFASVELAIILPVLLLLAVGLVDLVAQMRTAYRVERMAGEILNAITQLDPVTRDGIDAILRAAASIGGVNIAVSNTATLDGAIHVTGIQRNGNTNANLRLWNLSSYANPPTAVASRLTDPPSLPGGVIAPSGVQFIAVEVATQRVRWSTVLTQSLVGGATPAVFYAIAVARPRTATLTQGTLQ